MSDEISKEEIIIELVGEFFDSVSDAMTVYEWDEILIEAEKRVREL